MGLLLDGIVMDQITHQAIFACAVLFENPGEHGVAAEDVDEARAYGIGLLEALAGDEGMQAYWADTRSVETTSIWARM